MTSKERMVAALEGRKPDRLPVTTHHVMPYFLNQRLDGISADEFFARFGLDAIRWFMAFQPDAAQGARYDVIEHGGGDASSTVISPRIFDEFVAPYDAALTELAHAAGQRVVYHTCGGMMPLLERNLALVDFQPENQLTYALCYKCHDRNKLFYSPTSGNDAEVAMHKKHVVDKNVACTTCHDSHGSRAANHLINFNPNYVTGNGGSIQFLDKGTFHGSCTLTCHTIPHSNASY